MILRWQLFIGLIFLSAFFSYRLTKRIHVSAFLLLGFVLFSALLTSFQPFYSQDLISLRLRLVSARSFILVSMLVFFVSTLSAYKTQLFLKVMAVVATLNACVVLALLPQFPTGVGIFNAGSMDTTFIALCLPLHFSLRPEGKTKMFWFWIALVVPCVCAIVLTPGSTAYLVLFAAALGYFLARRKWKWGILAIASISILGILTQGKNLISDSGRLRPWGLFMDWFFNGPPKNWDTSEVLFQENWNAIMQWRVEHSPLVFGTGTGTFQWLGPTIQNVHENIFIWMHNEYLQVLFEQGFVGLLLMLWLIGVCLWRVRRRPILLATSFGLLASMLTQFPFRYPLSQLFVLLLVKVIFEETNERIETETFS